LDHDRSRSDKELIHFVQASAAPLFLLAVAVGYRISRRNDKP